MDYGICNLSIVPLRSEPSNKAELVSQIVFGEHFKVLETRKEWSKIRLAFDKYEGWIDNKQYLAHHQRILLRFGQTTTRARRKSGRLHHRQC